MSAINDAGKAWLSDYNVPGVPSSGEKDPPKAEGRNLFALIDTTINSVINGTIEGNATLYALRSSLFADLAHVAGSVGIVYADPTPAYNGFYLKSGASGSGAWTLYYVSLAPASDAEAIAGTITTKAVTPASLKAARAILPQLQTVNATDTGTLGDNALWAVAGSSYVLRGVNVRNVPLYVGRDGFTYARLAPTSFLASESATFLLPQVAIDLGARGGVFSVRKTGTTFYSYTSTQDGKFTLPYRAWDSAPVANSGLRGQLLATEDRLEVHMQYGQSWETHPMNTPSAPFTVDGEGYQAYTFQNAFGDPLQYVGVESQISLIVGFMGIGPGVGQSIGSVATETLARVRRDLAYQMRSILNWSAAYPGYTWAQLRPGSEPWAALVGYIAATKTYAAKYGLTPWFRAVGITEGAAGSSVDPVNASTAMATMCSDFDALDVNSGGDALQFIFDVTPAVSEDTVPYAQSWQQIAFCRANANGRTWMHGPRYQFPYVDNIHYTPKGYAKIGEQTAWAKHVVLDRKQSWAPFWLTYTGANPNITVSGSTVTIQVNSPIGYTGAVVRDTTTIQAATNDGLSVRVGGTPRTISSITLNTTSIVITLSAAIASSTAVEVSYCAYGAGAVSGTHSGVWGNLKKVGPASRFFSGETIDAWLVPFKETVTAA